MLYLKRKIDLFLQNWKMDPKRKPLIVRGPRQIGKTESILHFAKNHYESIICINFVEEPKYKMITADGYSAALKWSVFGTFKLAVEEFENENLKSS